MLLKKWTIRNIVKHYLCPTIKFEVFFKGYIKDQRAGTKGVNKPVVFLYVHLIKLMNKKIIRSSWLCPIPTVLSPKVSDVFLHSGYTYYFYVRHLTRTSFSGVASGGAGGADCPTTRVSVPKIRKVKFPFCHKYFLKISSKFTKCC